MSVSVSSAFSTSILTCSIIMKVMVSSRFWFLEGKVCRNSAIGFGSLMVTSTNSSLLMFFIFLTF